jgi:homoserine O-acetyltransferase
MFSAVATGPQVLRPSIRSPSSPTSGTPYGLRFPKVTIGDWTELHARLLDTLGIDRLYAVVGGSVGGQQALEMALRFPERIERTIIMAAGATAFGPRIVFQCRGPHLHSQ